MVNLLISFLFAICCTSCGYQWGSGNELTAQYATISVPYVDGDPNGSLTAAIIEEIARSGAFEYRANGGALELVVKIVDEREENIGFRYDRKRSGKLTNEIIPVETRLIVTVEVSVVQNVSQRVVMGPVLLSASVDYDHDYYFSRNGVNIFSLGQLIDVDEATDAAQVPLNRVLAQKIVDYITQAW